MKWRRLHPLDAVWASAIAGALAFAIAFLLRLP
jgi:hypothetical protein